MRVSLSALTLGLLIPAATGHIAHRQALSTPTPAAQTTLTITASPPAHALIESMRKAMVARRTVRVSMVSQSTWPGHAVLTWTWMDLDLQSNEMREIDTSERVQPNSSSISITVERRELVVAGGEGAWRTPGRPWSCERLTGVDVREGLTPFQMQLDGTTNLGPANVLGVPAWHLVATNSTRSTRIDLYLARSDDTLLRVRVDRIARLGGIESHDTDTETYRRYGKSITATLPKKCRRSGVPPG